MSSALYLFYSSGAWASGQLPGEKLGLFIKSVPTMLIVYDSLGKN